ncbi:MAG: DUF192 domain-containing protein [Limisphaerales bacterium]
MKLKKFLILFLTATLLAGCEKAEVAKPRSIDDILPKQAQPKLPTMKIVLCIARDNLFQPIEALDAELALTPQQEMTGMMFRTNIQETDAMLFVLAQPRRASFWMKNCPESISAPTSVRTASFRKSIIWSRTTQIPSWPQRRISNLFWKPKRAGLRGITSTREPLFAPSADRWRKLF